MPFISNQQQIALPLYETFQMFRQKCRYSDVFWIQLGCTCAELKVILLVMDGHPNYGRSPDDP